MLFKVISQFSKDDNNSWENYIEFSHLDQITDYCSLDSLLNYSVFTPESKEDWENCVNENSKLDMITNIDYARKIAANHPGSKVLGIVINPGNTGMDFPERLLGFDILDGDFSNSLLTNCGGFPEVFSNEAINRYGLIGSMDQAYKIRDQLRIRFHGDGHAQNCEVIAVYDYRDKDA
jgi:hypothetical protein